jgi:hypothetical protein
MPLSYELLTIPEVARALGYKTRWPVYDIIKKDKKLRACLVRGKLRVARADLDEYIARDRTLLLGEKKKNRPRLVAREVNA